MPSYGEERCSSIFARLFSFSLLWWRLQSIRHRKGLGAAENRHTPFEILSFLGSDARPKWGNNRQKRIKRTRSACPGPRFLSTFFFLSFRLCINNSIEIFRLNYCRSEARKRGDPWSIAEKAAVSDDVIISRCLVHRTFPIVLVGMPGGGGWGYSYDDEICQKLKTAAPKGWYILPPFEIVRISSDFASFAISTG